MDFEGKGVFFAEVFVLMGHELWSGFSGVCLYVGGA